MPTTFKIPHSPLLYKYLINVIKVKHIYHIYYYKKNTYKELQWKIISNKANV